MCDYGRHLVAGRISDNSSTSHAETISVLSVSHLLRFASGFFGALIPRLGYFQQNDPVFCCGFFSEAAAVLRKLAILFGALHDTSPCLMGPHAPNRNWRLTVKVPDQNLSSYGTYRPFRGSGPKLWGRVQWPPATNPSATGTTPASVSGSRSSRQPLKRKICSCRWPRRGGDWLNKPRA
jgi:hypothetical protein